MPSEHGCPGVLQRNGIPYVYVSRWLPRATTEATGRQASSSNGLQFDRVRRPAGPTRPDQRRYLAPADRSPTAQSKQEHGQAVSRPQSSRHSTRPAFLVLLAAISHERIGILRWATAAGATLQILREQISERLAYYPD